MSLVGCSYSDARRKPLCSAKSAEFSCFISQFFGTVELRSEPGLSGATRRVRATTVSWQSNYGRLADAVRVGDAILYESPVEDQAGTWTVESHVI